MPDLEDLQTKLDELTRTIDRQNELRDSGSDDYDWDLLDKANNQRNAVRQAIEGAGGTPGGQPRTDAPTGGEGSQPPPSGTPPTPPDPGASTVDQLQRELDRLANNPPHPGVRLEGGQVVGGSAEDLQEQLDWRGQVEALEHELTAAQADQAWAQAGGPDGFTDAELETIERARDRIDPIQERLDAVKRQIAEKEARLNEARGHLDSQGRQGGGPNAAGGAAIAVGARLQGELRELYNQEAAITQELNAALNALAEIVRTRVRSQLETGGVEVGLPNDRKGKDAVEEAFLRRVYRRLGLPYLPRGASGLLRGLTGAQSRWSDPSTRILALVALVVLVTIGLVAMNLLRGDDTAIPAVAISTPASSLVVDDSAVTDTEANDEVAVGTDDSLVTDAPAADEKPVFALPTPATALDIPFLCANVVHKPLVGFPDSLSFFRLAMLVGGQDGPIPAGTTLTVDAGGIAPNSAVIDGFEVEVPIPINQYGTYPVKSITAEGPDGPLLVDFTLDDVIVGSSEGPINGCLTPTLANTDGSDFLSGFPGLWFGDEPPSATGGTSTSADGPDFKVFLDDLDLAHESGDVDTLLGSLDGATFDRYGTGQCQGYLNQVVGSFVDPTLIEATAGAWEYVTDGVSTSVPDAWTLLIDVTLGGSEQQVAMHVRAHDGTISWFTDCGDPVG